MPHSLDTLLSLALHSELLLEVADSGVVPRLLSIAMSNPEASAAVALQLLQEICTLPAGRVNVAREDGARLLARLVQGERPAALTDPALHGAWSMVNMVNMVNMLCVMYIHTSSSGRLRNKKQATTSSPTALSLLAADNVHTPAVHKESVIGLLVDAAARPDWPARDTTLHALAQLASIDATSQYAVVTAGVIPVLVRLSDDGRP